MQNISTHKYMEKLDLTWSDDSIRFINTATPRARCNSEFPGGGDYFHASAF